MTAANSWLNERSLLGEAPDDFEPDPAVLAELRASNDAILAALPPAAVAAEIERRVRAERGSRSRAVWFFTGVAVAAAAALVLFVVYAGGAGDNAGERVATIDPAERNSGTRIKGDIRLVVHQKEADHVDRVRANTLVEDGDLLQLSYLAAGRKHGVIVSLDGRGTTTLHYPETRGSSTELIPSKLTQLEHAYRLDDAPRFERFFFAAADEPIDPDEIIHAVQDLAKSARPDSDALHLSPRFEQFSLILRKEESP